MEALLTMLLDCFEGAGQLPRPYAASPAHSADDPTWVVEDVALSEDEEGTPARYAWDTVTTPPSSPEALRRRSSVTVARRRASAIAVAYRWDISVADAEDLMHAVERAQGEGE